MVGLNNEEALTYVGGAKITTGFAIIIAGVVSFILGIFSGLKDPKPCNSNK